MQLLRTACVCFFSEHEAPSCAVVTRIRHRTQPSRETKKGHALGLISSGDLETARDDATIL